MNVVVIVVFVLLQIKQIYKSSKFEDFFIKLLNLLLLHSQIKRVLSFNFFMKYGKKYYSI